MKVHANLLSLMLKKDLQGWFKSHPAISPRIIAKEAGLNPDGRFQRYIKEVAKDGETVTTYYRTKIFPVIRKYDGYAELPQDQL